MAVIGEMIATGGRTLPPFALSEVEAHGMHVVLGGRLGVAFDFAQAERRCELRRGLCGNGQAR